MAMNNREIDALVAEKVMGWRYSKLPNVLALWITPDKMFHMEPPHYSTNMSNAWQVVEKLQQQGTLLTVETLIETYKCLIDGGRNGSVYNLAAPMAICLAALKAVGVEIEQSEVNA